MNFDLTCTECKTKFFFDREYMPCIEDIQCPHCKARLETDMYEDEETLNEVIWVSGKSIEVGAKATDRMYEGKITNIRVEKL